MVATYPNFRYKSTELKKFACAGSLFSIALKNEDKIIHVEMNEPQLFRQWLNDNCIEDICPRPANIL